MLRLQARIAALLMLAVSPVLGGGLEPQAPGTDDAATAPVELADGGEAGTVASPPADSANEAPPATASPAPRKRGKRFVLTLPELKEPTPAIELSLAEAVRMALANNLQLKIQYVNPLLEETRVLEALSAFDSTVFLQSVLEGKQSLLISPSSVDPISLAPIRDESNADNFTVATGIRKPLDSGGMFVTQFSVQRHRFNAAGPSRDLFGRLVVTPVINPSVTTHLTFSVQQPLLKGGGRRVAQAPTTISRLTRDAAYSTYQSQAISVIADVARAYWQLYYQRTLLRVQIWSLNEAQDLYDLTSEAVDLGALPTIELDRAAGGVAARKTQVVSARLGVTTAEDQLRFLLRGSEKDLSTETYLRLTDEPELEPGPLDQKTAVYTALTRRPDLQAAKEQAKANAVRLTVARNQLLPTLDVGASFSINGLGGNLDSALWSRTHEPLKEQGLFKSQYQDFRAYLSFELPLGRREAKSRYSRTSLAIQQQLFQIKDLEQQIVHDIRDAVETVNASVEQAENASDAEELARRRLQAEEEQYRAGAGRSLDVLDAQTAVATAETQTQKAILNYYLARVALAERQGTLLDEFLTGPMAVEYPTIKRGESSR